MKIVLFACLAAGALAPLGDAPSTRAQNPLAGSWMGSLQAGPTTLRLAFTVSESEDGLSATLVSVDQGNQSIPVDAVALEGETVTFSATAVGASYEGTLAENGSSIEGTFNQMGNALPLTFERSEGDAPAAAPRPQDPAEPFPYDAEEVTFVNPDGGHQLAGTFTRPSAGGPFPAAVLISGSGPQDRDEALAGHRPFLVLADHLTRQGIAVLRFDDRGVGESTGDFATATSTDFASDALAAVAFLQTRSDVDPGKIGLAGHSEGGLIAPMVAAQSSDVSYLVLMAGPGVNGERILYAQSALIAKAMGASDARIAEGRELSERIYAALKSDASPDETATVIEALIREQFDRSTPEELASSGVTEENREQVLAAQVQQVNTPWFKYFLTYEPAESLEQVTVPVLAINGEKDLQVPYEENLREIGAALDRAGNDSYELHALPGLNHLFQTAETGSPTEYGTIEETFAPSAMELIANWILETTGKGAS